MSKVPKTSKACVIVSIKVTFAPTPIFGIANGTSLGVIGSSNSSTWLLTTTCTSTDFVGKSKVQKTVVGSTPFLIYVGSFVVVAIGLLWEFTTTNINYTSENFWKMLTSTSTSLLFNQSYIYLSNCN